MDKYIHDILKDYIAPCNINQVIELVSSIYQNLQIENITLKNSVKFYRNNKDISTYKQIIYERITYYTPDNINVYNYKNDKVGRIDILNGITFKKEYITIHQSNSKIINGVKNKLVYL
jgi:hypothetical protein